MTPAEWTAILIALISAGLFKYLVDASRWWRSRRQAQTPAAQQAMTISTVDQSLSVVARARDELEADNTRLRRLMTEADARHEADRVRWELLDARRREEIEALESKLRALLGEVERLKDRHLYDDLEARRMRLPPPHEQIGPASQT